MFASLLIQGFLYLRYMKKHLLLVLLLAFTFPALAQYEYLAVAGVAAGLNALKGHPQKADEYVTQASYKGRTFLQKRTPTNKVPGKGGSQITAVEQQLSTFYTALQADATSPVMDADHEAALTAALAQLKDARPLWSTTAYSEEMSFYRRQESDRRYTRDELARKQAYQRQERDRTRRDSLQLLALRRSTIIDSTRRAVLAQVRSQQDSAARVRAAALSSIAEVGEMPAPTRAYVASPARTAVAHKPAVKKAVVKVKRSTGPTVYYCASGNTVKYHASPSCRGLARCGASVVPISLHEAETSMEPCKWCY